MYIDEKAYDAAEFIRHFNVKSFLRILNEHLDKWIEEFGE